MGVGTPHGFYPISVEKPRPEWAKRARGHCGPHHFHQLEIEGDVVEREEPIREELARDEEMAQVGAGKSTAGETRAFGIERRGVPRVAGMPDGQGPLAGRGSRLAGC